MNIFGWTLTELAEGIRPLGLPSYAPRQIAEWLYGKHATTFDAMTNLSLDARRALAERFGIERAAPVERAVSADGTCKYLFPAGSTRDAFVETAVIPDAGRFTLCLSTQIGCRRACRFCATGALGFHGQLSTGAILNQYASLPERDRITNIVYMGMGEPLDNLDAVLRSLEIFTADWGYRMSPTRLTVSTVGILPALERLITESRCHIALSVHSPFPEERRRWIPAEATHPLARSLETLRRARIGGQRRLMIEYIPFAGLNDTPKHARALARRLQGLRCRINLIPFNPTGNPALPASDPRRMEAFQAELQQHGFVVTIRKSRGADIAAACGLLAKIRPSDRPAEGSVAEDAAASAASGAPSTQP